MLAPVRRVPLPAVNSERRRRREELARDTERELPHWLLRLDVTVVADTTQYPLRKVRAGPLC